ncbi:uncharacterized protein LOC144707145 [Wolffia australiana]
MADNACEVYVSSSEGPRSLLRFVNWLRAELESNGIQCFASDHRCARDSRLHLTAREAAKTASLGVIVVAKETFSNPHSMEEIRLFLGKNILLPVFFGLREEDCRVLCRCEGSNDEWRSLVVKKLCSLECKLELCESNFRDCVLNAVVVVGRRLGRKGVEEKVLKWKELAAKMEYPFPRNNNFVGRDKELRQLELVLFGCEAENDDSNIEISTPGRYQSKLGLSLKKMQRKKGAVCVSNESGIGKTELVLEFAYRFSQMYKMIIWVSGESRYFRMNYLNILSTLGVNMVQEKELSPRNAGGAVNFMEAEGRAIRRVRKELERDIPFLLVIENLKDEKDWWDGRSLTEIIPSFGGPTHVLISTQMPTVMNLKPLNISYLSHSEAIILMWGRSKEPSHEEMAALDLAEVKLGRLPFGLAIFGALLSELSITPKKLRDAVEMIPVEDSLHGESSIFEKYRFLFKLLVFSSLVLDLADNQRNYATRRVLACSRFAPSPISVDIIFTAALKITQKKPCIQLLKKIQHSLKDMGKKPQVGSSNALTRLNMAKICSNKEGCIYFHQIIKEYSRIKGKICSAKAMVSAVLQKNPQNIDPEHVWAAGFLVFKLRTESPIVRIETLELLSFIDKHIIPLAMSTVSCSCRFEAACELLMAAEESLKNETSSYVEEGKQLWMSCSNRFAYQLGRSTFKEIYLLRLKILQTRAEMSLRGGYYGSAERLFRSALNITEVFYDSNHPELIAIRVKIKEMLELNKIFLLDPLLN